MLIQNHDQKQVIEEFIWAESSMGRVRNNGEGMTADGQSRNLVDHILLAQRKQKGPAKNKMRL